MKTSYEDIAFRFGSVEITSGALILHFHDEKTVIPLAEIKCYRLNWQLHDPVFAKKWWFLLLSVELENGQEECGPVASVKFNYLSDDLQSRRQIDRRLADALDRGDCQGGRARARDDLYLARLGEPEPAN